MDSLLVVLPAAAFAAGAALAWALAAARGSRGAERLAAAESTASAERSRRAELERRLGALEAEAAELGRARAVAEERVRVAQAMAEEQKRFLEQARGELEDSFRALASAALQGSTEQFLTLAEQKLATTRAQAAAELEERKAEIASLLAPLRETLERLDRNTAEIERARVDAYGRIDSQVKALFEATATLQEKTTSLASALRGTQVRGRWGEIALRNIVELAGMSEHCDFIEQETLDGGRRPDMTVRLPEGRRIAVDAKAPLAGYLEAVEATDEAARQAALKRHVQGLKGHVRELAARDYAASLPGGVDLVVMFLPGDPFLGAAFAQDPDLQVEALRSKVLIATPTTLVALLRTVAIYWQQRTLAENADAILDEARTLYERAVKFAEDLGAVRKGLEAAVGAYNRAVGSFKYRLLPSGRRLEEMKVAEHAKRRLAEPAPVGEVPRDLGQLELLDVEVPDRKEGEIGEELPEEAAEEVPEPAEG